MSDLLKRIANYFANEYDGDDKTAPKMELSVDEYATSNIIAWQPLPEPYQ